MPNVDAPSPAVNRDQQLRVFFSADLCGGDDYKHRWPTEDFAPPDAWPARFEQFFTEFDRQFRSRVATARERDDAAWLMPGPQLWKTDDDALLYMELVYPKHEMRHAALASAAKAFVTLVTEFDREYLPEGLGVRGCIWTAGFPFRNRPLTMEQGAIGHLDDLLEMPSIDPEHGAEPPKAATTATNYIGRDIDLGLRLANTVPPGRVICSLDLAQFLLDIPGRSAVLVWLTGWRILPGVFGGMPYPILLLDTGAAERRHPWEPDGPEVPDEVRALLTSKPLTKQQFRVLADALRAQHQHMIVPYASPDDMPEKHRRAWRTAISETRKTGSITIGASDADDGHSAPSHETRDIGLDELNKLLLNLQEHAALATKLRVVLRAVAEHPTYILWRDTDQFASMLFRLPRSIVFADDETRRLLEATGLVHDNVLRVKINTTDEQVFITDGLWISPAVRAFTFLDESDLLLKACEQQGWLDWATCIIDPATGAGHHPLRYSGAEVHRFGFDRNVRAIAFAAINAVLNARPKARFAINDIRSGIPPVFSQRPERVLFLANMPFALSSEPDAIARSADGGRFGYERTIDALDAFDALADDLGRESELRAVVLAYSVGDAARDTWYVPDWARDRFGTENVDWQLWPEERLWRVNGRKEQDNPMPLSRLELKADCRFYVREEADRDSVRSGYQALARELAGLGHYHLGYGVMAIRHPRPNVVT